MSKGIERVMNDVQEVRIMHHAYMSMVASLSNSYNQVSTKDQESVRDKLVSMGLQFKIDHNGYLRLSLTG